MEVVIDKVIQQITEDVADRDFTALAELLGFLPKPVLEAYINSSDDGRHYEAV